MKRVWLVIMAVISLLLTPTFDQNCDSLFIGNHTVMELANGSPSRSSGAQFGGEFLFGKLEIVASAGKWASNIGFDKIEYANKTVTNNLKNLRAYERKQILNSIDKHLAGC